MSTKVNGKIPFDFSGIGPMILWETARPGFELTSTEQSWGPHIQAKVYSLAMSSRFDVRVHVYCMVMLFLVAILCEY